ncbi:MAG: DHA2 family efflux MFS transporter permease subunit [Gordonia sp. (in: high G+C Gram-positive bacteria)]|uniref:DHA2 family efflux MFS transporter permease subunit n=1 Tax=Gordonia sp. (in: high G+C Gram-positive bacteria) TaxID=84139 RepID=UPI0039E572F7
MSQATPAAAAPDKLGRDVFVVAGVVVLGAIMSILDVTVVAVAQPTFINDFGTTAAGAAWSMTGYTLALAAVIPIASWAVGRFGAKKVYMTSLVLFVIGSILCAMATSIGTLVAFRMIQGLGGGLLMPVGMMIMTRAAGPERVGSVMAVLGIPMLLGPIAGPILGGWLIEIASWHWVFLINIPIGVVAVIYAWFALKDDDEKTKSSIDFLGLALLSPGLALFLFGVSSSAEHKTFNHTGVYIPMIIGAVLIVGFVAHALRSKKPLLDLRLFKNRTLAISVITMVTFMVAFFGASLLYPQYFITVRGESTLIAGLLLAPQGIGAMLTMPIAGKMTDKIGPGKFVLGGLVLILIGVSTFTQLTADTPYWIICLALFVQGLGMGMTMMPIMSSALASLKGAQVPDGSTLVNVIQQTSSSIGTAVITVIYTGLLTAPAMLAQLSNTMPALLPKQFTSLPAPAQEQAIAAGLDEAASAFADTFIIAVVLIAITFVPAFFLPRKKIVAAHSEDVDLDGDGGPAAPVIMH